MLPAPAPLRLEQHALFLDLDGTLFENELTPDLVEPDPEATALLHRLNASMDGAVAVMTGRTVDDADRLLESAVDFVSGLHGHECRVGAQVIRCKRGCDEAFAMGRRALENLVYAGALEATLHDRGVSLVLNYRHAPEHGALVARAVQEVATIHGLRALHGEHVSELMPAGADKAGAILAMLRGAPFAGRKPVAIADDVSDEDAFAAANAFGGVSVLVGAPKGRTCAKFGLPNVAAVRAWLQAPFAGALRARAGLHAAGPDPASKAA